MPPLPAFNNPEALWGLLLVPLLLWQAWRERRARATLRFSAAHVFARGGRGLRAYLLPLLPLLRVAAVTAAVLAIARPQVRDSRVRDLSVRASTSWWRWTCPRRWRPVTSVRRTACTSPRKC